MTVDIIKNGYIFPDRKIVFSVAKTTNQNGDLVNRTATNVDVKLLIPAGISVASFSSSVVGVTYTTGTAILNVPVVTSEAPVECYFMFLVDDVTTAINSQWTINFQDVTPDPLQIFTFSPIILGGLSTNDILAVVGTAVGPQGPIGAVGPANTLSIGSVTSGSTMDATISGTPPNQVIDFVLQKGDAGMSDDLQIGTVTTVSNTTPASASITGVSPTKFLNLSLPEGPTGIPGTGGEMNVQSDWDETNLGSDAYILNKPTIPAAQVSSDWNSVISPTQILNKPTIPTLISQLSNDTGFITATLTSEQVQDFMSSALAHAFHTNVSVTYNDAQNRFEIIGSVGGSSDGTITNMTQSGDNLVVTGTLSSFSGTLVNVFKDTIFDAQRVGNILEWYVNGVKVKDINLCCTVTKADVGLSNVPNIDATQRANHTGTQAQSTITSLTTDLASKQPNLVSGTNIKTINGTSVLGSGDLAITTTPSLISHALLSYTRVLLVTKSYNRLITDPIPFTLELTNNILTNDTRYTVNTTNHTISPISPSSMRHFCEMTIYMSSNLDTNFNVYIQDTVTNDVHFTAGTYLIANKYATLHFSFEMLTTSINPINIIVSSDAGTHTFTIISAKILLRPAY